MKTRNGFVSNSSSSSFIIGLYEVKNGEKETKYNQFEYFLGSELKNINDNRIQTSSRDIFINSFNDTLIINKNDINDNALYLVVNYYGCEGDYAFMNDPNDCDINYDIDISFFDDVKSIKEVFNDNNLVEIQMIYGAGRDG